MHSPACHQKCIKGYRRLPGSVIAILAITRRARADGAGVTVAESPESESDSSRLNRLKHNQSGLCDDARLGEGEGRETPGTKKHTHSGIYAFVPFTFCESHCKPSNRPSPVVAQLDIRHAGGLYSPGVDIPRAFPHLVQAELLSHLCRRHGWG